MNAPDRMRRSRLAESMPDIAAWVSDLRKAFGDAQMDDVIVRGRQGEPVFYASENGHSVGTRLPIASNAWSGEGLSDRRYCNGCDGSCIGTDRRCGRPAAAVRR
jgi:hypothetical protein